MVFHFSEIGEKQNKGVQFLYAIKTSGTTGASKIVQVPHMSIYPNIVDLRFVLNSTLLISEKNPLYLTLGEFI